MATEAGWALAAAMPWQVRPSTAASQHVGSNSLGRRVGEQSACTLWSIRRVVHTWRRYCVISTQTGVVSYSDKKARSVVHTHAVHRVLGTQGYCGRAGGRPWAVDAAKGVTFDCIVGAPVARVLAL